MPAILLLLAFACAAPVAPSGGPKDETPPSIIEEESFPNPYLNYNYEQIEITFDEWVELRNPAQQIVISPPMSARPSFTLRGKTLQIEIPEDVKLADNTTYMINFGEAITDITERNPLKNYAYVFSTGSYVDSLSLSATVVNSETGKPEPDVLVILHDNPSDTAFRKSLPAYFATTDEAGRCTLNYLRKDTFRIFALKDDNPNFRYDEPNEQIGFLDTMIVTDTAGGSFELVLFTPQKPLFTDDVIEGGGRVRISFTRPVEALDARFLMTEEEPLWRYVRDTLYVWHTITDTFQLELSEEGIPFDTVQLEAYMPALLQVALSADRKPYSPFSPVELSSRNPLDGIDTSRVSLKLGDTTEVTGYTLEIDSTGFNVLVNADWIPDARYAIQFLPGGLTNTFADINDTLDYTFSIGAEENYITVELEITNLDRRYAYLMEMLESNKEIKREYISPGVDSIMFTYAKMAQGKYVVRLTEDVNGNGKWDTGDLDNLSQPERLFTQSLEQTRPGWDLHAIIQWPKK